MLEWLGAAGAALFCMLGPLLGVKGVGVEAPESANAAVDKASTMTAV
jgi:hypothetical protein